MEDRSRFKASTKPARVKKFDTYVYRPDSIRSQASKPQINQNLPPKLKRSPTNVFVDQVQVESPRKNKQEIAFEAVLQSRYSSEVNGAGSFYGLEGSTMKKSSSVFMKLFYGVGFAVFVAAMAISAQTFVFNKNASEQVDVLSAQTVVTDDEGVEQGSGSFPSEDTPDDTAFFNYRVAPDHPRYLRVPSLSTYSRIKSLGTTTSGAVDAPWNVNDTGWYADSALPGSNSGVSLILGHVSGNTKPGVFKKINTLKSGDTIEIEKGNADVIKYVVERIEEIPVDEIDMAKVLYDTPANTHSLRLMTCSGDYDKTTRSYSSRTIVYANPIN